MAKQNFIGRLSELGALESALSGAPAVVLVGGGGEPSIEQLESLGRPFDLALARLALGSA